MSTILKSIRPRTHESVKELTQMIQKSFMPLFLHTSSVTHKIFCTLSSFLLIAIIGFGLQFYANEVNAQSISIAVKNNISSIAEGSDAVFVITSSVEVSDTNGLDVDIRLTDQNNHLPMGTNLTPTVNIAMGETTGELSLPTMVNRTIRRGGLIQAMVTTGTGYQVVDPSASTLEHTATITINAVPIISIRSRDDVTNINEGEAVEFFITTDEEPATDAGLDVNVKLTVSGNFLAPNTNLIPVVNIGKFRQVTNLMVQTINDKNSNDDGSITAMITAGTGYVLADPSTSTRKHTLMIMVNNIIFPTVSISAASLRITEGDTANFTITASPSLPAGTELTVMVKIEVNNIQISATPGVGTHRVRIQSGGEPATATLDIESLADAKSGTFGTITATIQMNPDNFNLSTKSQVIVAVIDDDQRRVSIESNKQQYMAGEPIVITLTASHVSNSPLEITIDIDDENGILLWRIPKIVQLTSIFTFTVQTSTNIPMGSSEIIFRIAANPGTNTLYQIDSSVSITVNQGSSSDQQQRISVADAVVSAILADPPGRSIEPQLTDVGSNIKPKVSISAVGSKIEEGSVAQFQLIASERISRTINVNLNVLDSWNFIKGIAPQLIHLTPTNSPYLVSIETADDTEATPDGMISIEILTGEDYVVGDSNIATVIVSDLDDRLRTPNKWQI